MPTAWLTTDMLLTKRRLRTAFHSRTKHATDAHRLDQQTAVSQRQRHRIYDKLRRTAEHTRLSEKQ